LDRDLWLEHSDSARKGLTTRAEEEGYSGATGEIVAVEYVSCDVADGNQNRYHSELADRFRDSIRNSAPHYHGLMSQTGQAWDQYGASILKRRVMIQGYCMEKTTLTLVVGHQFTDLSSSNSY
jgi:hypothetical protein